MKSFWRILALILLLLMTILLALPVQAAADPSQYPDYTKTGMLQPTNTGNPFPWTRLPTPFRPGLTCRQALPTTRLQGDFRQLRLISCHSLEIAKVDTKLLWQQDEKNATEILFDKIDLRIGKWVHLSVTRNPPPASLPAISTASKNSR